MAYMFFPTDEVKRRSYEHACLGVAASILLDQGFHKSLAADEAWQLFDLARAAPAYDGLKAEALRMIRRNDTKAHFQARPVLAGSVAANALLIPLICNLKYGRSDVGLHQAFRVMLGTDQKDDPTGLRNLQNIWRHYQPASHLWAAWGMCGWHIMNDADDFKVFVSLSEIIRAWAEQYKPLRANRPMLSDTVVFKVPDDWVGPFRFDLLLCDVDLAPRRRRSSSDFPTDEKRLFTGELLFFIRATDGLHP